MSDFLNLFVGFRVKRLRERYDELDISDPLPPNGFGKMALEENAHAGDGINMQYIPFDSRDQETGNVTPKDDISLRGSPPSLGDGRI